MLEAQTLRSDSDFFATPPSQDEESLFDHIRPYLTAQEAKLMGFDPANDEERQPRSILPSLLAGIGATLSTIVLFSVVGIVSTLGMPEVGGATASFV